MGHRRNEKSFSNSWWAMEKDSLGAFDVKAGNEVWVEERVGDHFEEGLDGSF
jgi:hypothetical protein